MSLIGENLIRLVRETAAGRPDFVNNLNGGLCKYVVDGEPSCLIGQALWKADLIGPTFERNERNSVAFGHISVHLGLALDQAEINWLRQVQYLQDSGIAWGVAVSGADKRWPINATE